MTPLNRDFTLEKYKDLCHELKKNYRISPVINYLSRKPQGKVVVLRHDIDRNIMNAFRMAEIEYEMDIRSTYYFRFPYTFKPDIIRKIQNFGHEIGYHYEILSKTRGNYEKAIDLFELELGEFKRICDIKTICMHGSPLSKFDNRDLWKRYNFQDFGIVGEAYLSFNDTNIDLQYFTDTGRTWSGKKSIRDVIPTQSEITNIKKNIHSTDQLIDWLKKEIPGELYLTIHPERWSNNFMEWILWGLLDHSMNFGKQIFTK